MPRRLWSIDSLPLRVYEQLCGELLINPYEEVRLMGRHFDDDGNGVADQADADAAALRENNPEPWCEDRADPDSWDDPDIIDTPEVTDAVAD